MAHRSLCTSTGSPAGGCLFSMTLTGTSGANSSGMKSKPTANRPSTLDWCASSILGPHCNKVVTAGAALEGVFRDGKSAGVFLEDPMTVDLSRCIVLKTAVTKVRARLVTSLSPAPTAALPAPLIISSAPTALPVPSPSGTVGTVPAEFPPSIEPMPVVFDPITAKHGKKRFWDLFELYARNRTWGEDQTRRMTTEASPFRDLMGDPELGEIELETIDQYASRLAQLPSDTRASVTCRQDARDKAHRCAGHETQGRYNQEALGTLDLVAQN